MAYLSIIFSRNLSSIEPFFSSIFVTILGSPIKVFANHQKCLFSIFTPVFSTDHLKHLNFHAKNAKSFFFTSLLLLKLSEEEILNNINVFPPTPEKLGTLPYTPATPVTERRGRLAPLTLFQQSWQGQPLKLASYSPSHFKTTPTITTQKSWKNEKSFDHKGSNLSTLGYLEFLTTHPFSIRVNHVWQKFEKMSHF